ncbi:MAG: ABC transporter permease [Gemmatimonadetes bacterium]|nr:ABC transporter permease [Gemmatimonadota bacterium]
MATGLIALSLTVPILYLGWRLFGEVGEAWTDVVADLLPGYALNSLILLLGVGALTLLVGTPIAWLVVVYRFPGRAFFAWTLVLPLAIPTYITAYTYAGIFGYGGPVRQVLAALGLARLGPHLDITNIYGVIGVMAFALYPYVYLTARASFAQQSNAVIEAAQSLGKTPFQAFWRLALPLGRPALVGGASLVGMETLNEYGAVKYFGVDTFTTGIFSAWFSLGDADAAIRLAACALVFVFAVLSLERAQRGQRRFAESRQTHPLRPRHLVGIRGAGACVLCALPFVLGFALPVSQLGVWALRTWHQTIGVGFFGLMWHSFALAALAALLVVCVALLLVYTERLYGSYGVRLLGRIATLGYSVPGAVIAVGVMLPFVQIDRILDQAAQAWLGFSTGLLLSATLGALVFAYLVRYLAVGYQSVQAGFEGLDRHVEEAARSLGAGPWRTLMRVDVPLVKTMLLSAGMLVFVDVLKELPLTLILRPFNFDTLATRAFELASDEEVPASANAALIIAALGTLSVLLLNRLMARREA